MCSNQSVCAQWMSKRKASAFGAAAPPPRALQRIVKVPGEDRDETNEALDTKMYIFVSESLKKIPCVSHVRCCWSDSKRSYGHGFVLNGHGAEKRTGHA